MIDIIKHKKWFFIFSLVLIIPGLVSLALYGLNLSIDFTGGTRISLLFPKTVTEQQVSNVRSVFEKEQVEVQTIQRSENAIFLRTSAVDEKKNTRIVSELGKKVGQFRQEEFETIGPTIGRELGLNALKAIALASLLIVLYIAYSFRSVPKPTSSWRFGITAIATLIHDMLILIGLFSIFGKLFQVEVDGLFVTALLTVMGFSIHDTIVVFDRIRENLLRTTGMSFPEIVNESLLQTFTRSLNTSLTAILVLITMLIFGGESVRWFIVALVIGMTVGTYSSLFNAAQLLVAWHEYDLKKKKK